MHDVFPFLIPIVLFVVIGATAILRGPLGKALGERIGRGGGREDSAEATALKAEMEEFRYRLTEMEERLDFTERVLAQHRQTEPPRIKAE